MSDPSRRFLAALAILLAVLILARIRNGAPRPKTATAPSSEFSAGRAAAVLRDLVGEGRPHPIGSAANREVRDRIVAKLTDLGYRPELQRRFVCREYISCATVENILALHPGTTGGKSVLLAVHYDSVPAGPGASDDGAGVAALLEIARIVRAETHRNPIVFLIDDGEEAGLLGAKAFLDHPLAKSVGAIVNLEARGTEGASFMFETSRHNRRLVSRMRSAVERPATSSLYYSIYQRLPNDTDFTVFKAAGLAGVNFGFIGGATRYHTRIDDLAHASLASLQHHGDNALAMARNLAEADLESLPVGESVYFDLLQFGILSWPSAWIWPLAILAVVSIVHAIARLRCRPSHIILGFIGWLGSCLGALFLGLAGAYVLRKAGAFPSQWVAHPAAAIALFWLLGVGVAWWVAVWIGARARFDGLWSGAALGWLLLALLASAFVPGASYLFVPVAIGFAWPRAVLVPTTIAALILIPTAIPLYDAMGLTLLPIISFIVAAMATIHAPLLPELPQRPRRGAIWVAAAGVIIALGIALICEPYSRENPRRLNIAYRVDADRAARHWTIGAGQALPPSIQRAAAWKRLSDPLTGAEQFVADANGPALPMPSLAVVSDVPEEKGRRVTLAVRPARGGARVNVALRAGERIESMHVNGVDLGRPAPGARRWSEPGVVRIALRFAGESELRIDLVVRDREPIDGDLEELSFGLPPEGAFLQRARPAWAVPSQNGDTTDVTRRIRI